MNILLVNSHHHYTGGAEKYYFDLAKLLSSHGHEVAFFSTKHKNNIRTKWNKFFVKEINYDKRTPTNYLTIICRYLSASDDRKRIRRIIDIFKPDVVHINNIYYYISPYVLKEIKKENIPVVQTIHDYQIISPNVNLYSKGEIDEQTKRHKYYKVILNKSVKNSFMASLLACLYAYREFILNIHRSSINLFITPSIFMKNKLASYGIDKRKILYLPNFIMKTNVKTFRIQKRSNRYVLFFGKLAEHKGIYDILNVARMLPDVNFVIAGDTSNIKILEALRKINQPNVKIIKKPKSTVLKQLINNCCFSMCPSRWFENQPYVILESYLAGKPVVASDIGGISEIVLDGKTGCLFAPGNLKEMAKVIQKLWKNPDLTDKMGKYAQSYVRKKFNAENYYNNIIKIYTKLITS